uniref:Coenzyme PQQ synthesis protein E n=1 Tax=Lygus hesperus TaxID=30085 RepID=A0A0A9Y502_LYGHE
MNLHQLTEQTDEQKRENDIEMESQQYPGTALISRSDQMHVVHIMDECSQGMNVTAMASVVDLQDSKTTGPNDIRYQTYPDRKESPEMAVIFLFCSSNSP